MQTKFRPPALVFALLALAPALPALSAEALEGAWVLTEVLDPDGAPIPLREPPPGFTLTLTFNGPRYAFGFMNPKTGECMVEETGTFVTARGILLRFRSGDGGEPVDIPYVLEDGVLTLRYMADGTILMTMIFRRE